MDCFVDKFSSYIHNIYIYYIRKLQHQVNISGNLVGWLGVHVGGLHSLTASLLENSCLEDHPACWIGFRRG